MARKPNEAPVDEQKPSGKLVLKKNHGLLIAGKTHAFYPAGSEFDPETDAALIFQLVQSGAQFE
ncbi:hypothetical protein [Burkholderia ubonensis]|uniref:hypothetical protein n=1 Tax=Burkholderia ubonensis TaxID=101571 RepID=UPI000755B6D8|nr:hypothetical protein [Burkholderia ubonensis]KVC81392.1 hypothetical protein WI75_08555 [Burkholderia ubonensis]